MKREMLCRGTARIFIVARLGFSCRAGLGSSGQKGDVPRPPCHTLGDSLDQAAVAERGGAGTIALAAGMQGTAAGPQVAVVALGLGIHLAPAAREAGMAEHGQDGRAGDRGTNQGQDLIDRGQQAQRVLPGVAQIS